MGSCQYASTLFPYFRFNLLTAAHSRNVQYMLRDNIRRKLGISGSFFGDLFVSYCCLPCSLSQESAELDNLMKLERPPVPMT